MQIDEGAVGDELLDQVRRCGNESDPEPRRQHLRQRADIRHHACSIDAGHRQDWLAAVVKLVIVIVFDHGEALLRRKVQELEPARTG